MILVFWMLNFKPAFLLSFCTFIKRLFSSSSLSAIMVLLSSAYLRLYQFSSVQSLSRVRLFATPWIAAHQASLSITNSRTSLRLTSIRSVMPSSHLILCRPLLLLPPIPPESESFPMSQLFAWGGQSTGVSALASVLPKKVVCHSLLQWTSFCQTSPPWPAGLGWPHTAWLSFIELDKAVVLVWLVWLVFCDYGFSVSALWCPLATPTV